MNTTRNLLTALSALVVLALPSAAAAEEPAPTPAPVPIPDCTNIPGQQDSAPAGLSPYWVGMGSSLKPFTQADSDRWKQALAGFENPSVQCVLGTTDVSPTVDLAGLDAAGRMVVLLFRTDVTLTLRDGNDLVKPDVTTPQSLKGTMTIRGEAGNDTILGLGYAINVLDGGAGDDRLNGGVSNDTLTGGPGNDRLDAGPGKDKLLGGPGNDVLSTEDTKGAKGGDVANCGAGKRDVAYIDKGDRTIGCEKVVVVYSAD